MTPEEELIAAVEEVIASYEKADNGEKYDECKWAAFSGVGKLEEALANYKKSKQ